VVFSGHTDRAPKWLWVPVFLFSLRFLQCL